MSRQYKIDMNVITDSTTFSEVFTLNKVEQWEYCDYVFYNDNNEIYNFSSVNMTAHENHPFKKKVTGNNIMLRVRVKLPN